MAAGSGPGLPALTEPPSGPQGINPPAGHHSALQESVHPPDASTWVMSPSTAQPRSATAESSRQVTHTLMPVGEPLSRGGQDGGLLQIPTLAVAHVSAQMAGNGYPCDVCGSNARVMWTCAMCSAQGHRECLHIEFVAGIPFCFQCMPGAQAAYARHTQEQRTRWMQSMSRQIADWRQTIMNTSSAAASVGIVAGATTGAIIAWGRLLGTRSG